MNLSGFENDPGVGKYVNQDGLQQLRHYLKVGPYKSYCKDSKFINVRPHQIQSTDFILFFISVTGSNKAFMGYIRQVILHKRKKRDLNSQDTYFHLWNSSLCSNMANASDNSLANLTSASPALLCFSPEEEKKVASNL